MYVDTRRSLGSVRQMVEKVGDDPSEVALYLGAVQPLRLAAGGEVPQRRGIQREGRWKSPEITRGVHPQ